MMGSQLGAAALALVAAFCFAASNVLEQRKAVEAPPETSMRIALFWHLAKQPLWWLGIFVDVGGFIAQLTALRFADVVFVQPILVMSLPFSLTLGAAAGSHRLSRRDLGLAFMLVACLAVFLGVADPSGGRVELPVAQWLIPSLVIGGIVGSCLLMARGSTGPVRAALLGAAAGTIHGTTAVLMRIVSYHLSGAGLIHILQFWETWALIILVPTGFLMVQSSFQAGDLRAGLPALEVAEPFVASILGVMLLHEALEVHSLGAKAVICLTVIGMGWTAIELARSSAIDQEEAAAADEAEGQPRPPLGTPRPGHV
jgi:hypothetical protein